MEEFIQLGVFADEDDVSTPDLPDPNALWAARDGTVRQERKVFRAGVRPVAPVEQAPEADLGVADLEGAALDDLTLTGWAVLYGANTSQEIKDNLAPLVAFRRAEVGNDQLFKVFDGDQGGYTAGQSAEQWLKQFKVTSTAQVGDVSKVPFYVMIVASPEDIPFAFQYTLDIYWGVGRLWLQNPEDYAAYAKAVIAAEQAEQAQTSKHITFFAPVFANDEATRRTCAGLVTPLLPVGPKNQFGVNLITGEDATRDRLVDLYSGQTTRPAIYFCGSHGVKRDSKSAQLPETMGAILCEKWDGKSGPVSTQYMAARDLRADTDLTGTMHILFACYACGWPKERELDKTPIAPATGVARLPQKLLAKGALAVFGHIDVVWSYSYEGDGGIDRSQEYGGMLKRLMIGARVGHATDAFNIRWNVMAGIIAEGMRVPTLTGDAARVLWIQHDDARNYVIYGDPAVRLRPQTMKPEPAQPTQRDTNLAGAPVTS